MFRIGILCLLMWAFSAHADVVGAQGKRVEEDLLGTK